MELREVRCSMAKKKDRAKKSVMADIKEEVEYGHPGADANCVVSSVMEHLMEQGEDAMHHGNYTSVLHIIEDLQYIENNSLSLEKYAARLIGKKGDD